MSQNQILDFVAEFAPYKISPQHRTLQLFCFFAHSLGCVSVFVTDVTHGDLCVPEGRANSLRLMSHETATKNDIDRMTLQKTYG